jgi:5-methylcytosine-specific restriction endonuclease McrA
MINDYTPKIWPKIVCPECGKKFTKKNASNIFCSDKCIYQRRYKNLTNIDSYREFVFERDNWTCKKCKMVAKKMSDLNTHHQIPIYKGGNPGVDNMITLCEKCHKVFHKIMK